MWDFQSLFPPESLIKAASQSTCHRGGMIYNNPESRKGPQLRGSLQADQWWRAKVLSSCSCRDWGRHRWRMGWEHPDPIIRGFFVCFFFYFFFCCPHTARSFTYELIPRISKVVYHKVLCLFVCLFVCFPNRDYFTHIDLFSLSVKDCKIETSPMFGTYRLFCSKENTLLCYTYACCDTEPRLFKKSHQKNRSKWVALYGMQGYWGPIVKHIRFSALEYKDSRRFLARVPDVFNHRMSPKVYVV